MAGGRHSQGNMAQSQLYCLIIQDMVQLISQLELPCLQHSHFGEPSVVICCLFHAAGIAEKKHFSAHHNKECTEPAKHCLRDSRKASKVCAH